MDIVHFTSGRINPAAAKVGLVNVIYWLALEQAQAGHNVTVVVSPEKRDYENAATAAFKILEYAPPSRGGFALDRQLLRDIDSGALKIDIAHLHGVWSPTVVAVGAALRKRRIPYVVSSHGSFSPGIRQRQVLRKWSFRVLFGLPLVNKSLFVHIHSQDEAKDALEFGVAAPIFVAEQGFSRDAIPPELVPDWLSQKFPQHRTSFKLLFLGRLDPWHKGIDHLLEAVALARGSVQDIALFLVGPKKRRYSSEIPKLITRLGLAENVVLVGPLYDPREKYSALASADLFVLTSRFEGFPLTVLEAMACGVPVLVTRGTNAGSMLADDLAGIVCESRPQEIANAIVKAASAPDSLSSMAVCGLELVKSRTWERTSALLVGEYARKLKGIVE
jgi:glycosyltransferase involved in cell wall biosynthesis